MRKIELKAIKIKDPIYGEQVIKEPVALELLALPELRRLQGVDQAGWHIFQPKPPNKNIYFSIYNRLAHSLGVYFLLKKYRAPLREQIAGLIHDVSHTAFSHCADYVLARGSEKKHNYQDKIFKKFVEKTEIPEILKKHKLDPDYLLNENNFPLKEKGLPDLCADRIDYLIRAAVVFKEIDEKEKRIIFKNLKTRERKWFFQNIESAERFAALFKKINKIYFSGLPSAIMFRTVGDYLKWALKKGYISPSELYVTDKEILAKIKKFFRQDKILQKLYRRMSGKIKIINDPQNYQAKVFCKSRVVDPFFIEGKKLKRLTEAKKEWREIIAKESRPKVYYLRFLD